MSEERAKGGDITHSETKETDVNKIRATLPTTHINVSLSFRRGTMNWRLHGEYTHDKQRMNQEGGGGHFVYKDNVSIGTMEQHLKELKEK